VRYKAVFFDAGETLLSPHPSFPELFRKVLRDEGFDVDPAALRERLPALADRFRQAAGEGVLWSTSMDLSKRWWSSIYQELIEGLGLPFTPDLAGTLYRTFTDEANYRLFPDVEPTLERLRRAGLMLGVISNFEEWLERLLESLQVTRFFDVRVISGVEGMEKPDPHLFLLAMERGGVGPEHSAYVGDSPYFDVEPAVAVGMFGILLDRRGRHQDHQGPRIASLEELPALLGADGS
jgi:putative hydrolase of the HAD superfamily